MPHASCFLAGDDPRRLGEGLVYHDPALAKAPATHVLVVGVAALRSANFPLNLTTATLSARNLADWFLAPGKARFSNAGQPLGSVALLLSETTQPSQAPLATYGGGEVPRATSARVKAALGKWLKRLHGHPDNLAILYVASHGQSLNGRTAFLLEDFGSAPQNATFGLVNVEQLFGTLENAWATRQLLLIDCCRNATDVKLAAEEMFGTPLVVLPRDPKDHGQPRNQWGICSTTLGQVATGLAAGPTLFNLALLDALNGVASDVSAEGWPVRPGTLVDRVTRILDLYRRPDESVQLPAGRISGSFDITLPGESSDVPVYISLYDPSLWPDSTLTVTVDGVAQDTIAHQGGAGPFYLARYKDQADVRVSAEHDGESLGSNTARVRAPVLFLQVSPPREDKQRPPMLGLQKWTPTRDDLFQALKFGTVIRPRAGAGKPPPSLSATVRVVGALSMGLDEARPANGHATPAFDIGRERSNTVALGENQLGDFDSSVAPGTPVFIKVRHADGYEEYAAVPARQHIGPLGDSRWCAEVRIDLGAARYEAMTRVHIDDRRWSKLLGCVAARNFVEGEKLLDEGLAEDVLGAIRNKVLNNVAATAGALVAVGAASPKVEEHWDPWLRNLCQWFPGLPDGPIILGRRLMSRARSQAQIDEAGAWFLEGYRRGVPYYSLSLDWLAQGLESVPGNSAELLEKRRIARELSIRVDPARTFTVIRLRNAGA